MDLLNILAMLEALKLKVIKYGKIEDLQAQVVTFAFIFILEYRIPYYQEGCNISFMTKSKCS